MNRLVPALLTLAFVLPLGSCTSKPEATDPHLARLNSLYIELEQKHTRQVERFGFSLEYALEPPNTIAIILKYDPMSEKGPLAKDVAEKARGFVKGLAAEKYQLLDLNVRSENIRLNVEKD